MNESTDKATIAGLTAMNKELTSELFEVNRRLKESEAFKSHFISNITNEILNPFSSILALSENITNLNDADIKQARKMGGLIHREAHQLNFQMKNIFAAAMIEAGLDKLIPGSVNVADLADRAVHFFSFEISRKQLATDLQIEEHSGVRSFVTDEAKLDLIVKNLLSNAVKFSPPKGVIKIRLGIEEGRLKLTVRDFGPGIPEEEYKVIFDRFRRLDQSISSLNTGQGLGLSIVNAYLLELNGIISLDSPSGGGFEVMIDLPELVRPDEGDDLGDFLLNSEEKF
ncbi:MAG: HAMP domain-containing sensor histidine kinase [Prolixibacteraceae bacterium]